MDFSGRARGSTSHLASAFPEARPDLLHGWNLRTGDIRNSWIEAGQVLRWRGLPSTEAASDRRDSLRPIIVGNHQMTECCRRRCLGPPGRRGDRNHPVPSCVRVDVTRAMVWLAAALAVSAVAGCSGPEGESAHEPVSIASTQYRGMPSDASRSAPLIGNAIAIRRGNRLDLTLWGSGSCPPVPISLKASNPRTVEVTVSKDYGARACTADMAALTSVLDLPAVLDPGTPLTVRVLGLATDPVVLTARPQG